MKVKLETTDSVYRKLFTVKFLHSAYETPMENFLSTGITIGPDENTKELFKNYKMNFGFYDNTLVCFIQCTPFNPPAAEPKIPSTKIDGDIKIRFLIKNSSDFFSKTYVVPAGNKKVYQFSNQIDNTGGGNIFLTEPVENHVIAKDYDAGTVVQEGGSLYSSLKSVAAADNIAITDATFWKKLQGSEQVVNNADLQDASTVDADETCFAVLDMYNTGTVNNSYNLFDVSEKLFNPAPSFTIKFEGKF